VGATWAVSKPITAVGVESPTAKWLPPSVSDAPPVAAELKLEMKVRRGPL